jgi:predicted dehydrogenase
MLVKTGGSALKIGTVGTNFIVPRFIEAARKQGAAEVAAAYSRNGENAAAFAKKNGIPRFSTDRNAFLADAELDFIYIASPNSLHYAWAKDALLAGKNVICEKPFVSREWELRSLADLARRRGLFLCEGMMIPHLPNYHLIREHISKIGDIRLVQMNFSQYSSRYDAFLHNGNPNIFNPEFSGGALMDLGYYNLYFIIGLFGAPKDIQYFPNIAKNGIDTSGVMVAKYPGFVCSAVCAKDSESQNFVQIQGECGFICAHTPSSELSDGIAVFSKTDGESHYNAQTEGNNLYYEIRDFVNDFEAGDRTRCEELLKLSLLAARLLDRMRDNAAIVFAADG